MDGGGRGRGGRQAIEGADQEVNQVRSRDAGQLGYIDVGDASAVTPVAKDQADFPFEVVAIGLIGVSAGVGNGPLAHVAMLEAGDLALGERAVESVIAPGGEDDGGVGVAGTATVENVVGGLGVGGGLSAVPGHEPGEAFGVQVLVAVDDGSGDLLGHAFKEGFDFRQPELGGVAVEIGDVFVDHRVGFEIAAGVGDLRGGGLGVRHAGVEQAPGGLGETGADRGFVPGRQVAFHDEHVVEDFVGLAEELDDRGDSVAIVHAFGPVGVGKCR